MPEQFKKIQINSKHNKHATLITSLSNLYNWK